MIETNTILLGDCIEYLKGLPDKCIDLVLTDPPYLINYRSNRRIKQDKFDYIQNDDNNKELIKEFLLQSYRILKDNTAIYCFCSWHNIDFFKMEFEKYFNLKNIIVWVKNNHGTGDLKGSYAPKHEFILFGHKGRALNKDKRLPDVVEHPKINSQYLTHPTEKPIDLLKIFIKNNTDNGDLVLDPFCGTGSTLQACKELNRKYVGIEIIDRYYKIACERLDYGE